MIFLPKYIILYASTADFETELEVSISAMLAYKITHVATKYHKDKTMGKGYFKNRIMLPWHEYSFENKNSFAFIIYPQTECIEKYQFYRVSQKKIQESGTHKTAFLEYFLEYFLQGVGTYLFMDFS